MFEIDERKFEYLSDVIDYIESEYADDVDGQSWWENGKELYGDDPDEILDWLDSNGYTVNYQFKM